MSLFPILIEKFFAVEKMGLRSAQVQDLPSLLQKRVRRKGPAPLKPGERLGETQPRC